LKIQSFEWNERNTEHIARHYITPEEVEEVFLDALFRKGREGRLLAYGVSGAGRYIFVVTAIQTGGIARVITARDMTKPERRYYLREKGVR
jgi:uncharacterized DUF497 family protein